MSDSIPHNRLTYDEAECEAVVRTVQSGYWAQGPRVCELEAVLARIAGVQHATCVASGLAALRLALGALDVRSGDSVLVPAYSCVALANASLAWGASPVPVDVDPADWNLEPEQCVAAIAKHRPRAVIAVHTFGTPAALSKIRAVGAPVVEDCAHAFGLELGDGALGGRAEVGVLSFYATKLIGSGEGGAVLTNSAEIAKFVRSARDYGDQPPCAYRMNDKMNDLEASLVLAQLKRLPEMISARAALAQRYGELLGSSQENHFFRIPDVRQRRVWYRFAVEMVQAGGESIVSGLERRGVHAAIPVKDWRASDSPFCPVADRAYGHVVSLPLYPTLTIAEQDRVVETFLSVSGECARA
jgi:dTDP-4-amino-4,6-dideoxygalactose transaminase